VVQHHEAARPAERAVGEGHFGAVAVVHRDVRPGEAAGQRVGELLVDLDGGEPGAPLRQEIGRAPGPRPHLQDVVAQFGAVVEHPRQQVPGEERRPLIRRQAFDVFPVHRSSSWSPLRAPHRLSRPCGGVIPT
jgi:hypothetical protein